jgi:hypothetical protein
VSKRKRKNTYRRSRGVCAALRALPVPHGRIRHAGRPRAPCIWICIAHAAYEFRYIHGSPLALNWTLRKRDYLCRIGCVLTVLTWTHVGCILLEATSGGPGLDEDRTGVVAYAPPA